MRFPVPLCAFLAVAAFQSALSASLESAEKEEVAAQHDGETELQKIDQMEFEAAQKNEVAHKNVTEEQGDDTHYLEAVQDGSVKEHSEAGGDHTAHGGGNSDAREDPESSEEADGHHEAKTGTVSRAGEASHDSTKEQDAPE